MKQPHLRGNAAHLRPVFSQRHKFFYAIGRERRVVIKKKHVIGARFKGGFHTPVIRPRPPQVMLKLENAHAAVVAIALPDEFDRVIGAAVIKKHKTGVFIPLGNEAVVTGLQVFEAVPIDDKYVNERLHHDGAEYTMRRRRCHETAGGLSRPTQWMSPFVKRKIKRSSKWKRLFLILMD